MQINLPRKLLVRLSESHHLLPGILASHVLSPLLSSLERSNFENYHSQYYGYCILR